MPNVQWEWNQTQSSGLSVNSFIDEWIHQSYIFKLYRIIPILRLLKVKRTQPDLYKATVERFESHWEERKQQPEAANFIKYIGAFIRWWRGKRSKTSFVNVISGSVLVRTGWVTVTWSTCMASSRPMGWVTWPGRAHVPCSSTPTCPWCHTRVCPTRRSAHIQTGKLQSIKISSCL